MLGNLAVIFLDQFGSLEVYQFNKFDAFLEVMQKSKNTTVRKNGIRALIFFYEKLDRIEQTNRKFFEEFLMDVLLFDKDIDNLIRSLTVLEKHLLKNIHIVDIGCHLLKSHEHLGRNFQTSLVLKKQFQK